MYYFLPEDYKRLNDEITDINNRIAEVGKEMGESCKEGAETFHDNFAYEDGERQQFMLSTRLRKLIGIRNNARITNSVNDRIVSIGKTITVIDDENVEHVYKIASYLTFTNDDSSISYNCPLARILVGAKIGESRSGKIGHSTRTYRIKNIT